MVAPGERGPHAGSPRGVLERAQASVTRGSRPLREPEPALAGDRYGTSSSGDRPGLHLSRVHDPLASARGSVPPLVIYAAFAGSTFIVVR